MNDRARVSLRGLAPVFWDPYKKNPQTGSVLLVDEFTHATVAAGMSWARLALGQFAGASGTASFHRRQATFRRPAKPAGRDAKQRS